MRTHGNKSACAYAFFWCPYDSCSKTALRYSVVSCIPNLPPHSFFRNPSVDKSDRPCIPGRLCSCGDWELTSRPRLYLDKLVSESEDVNPKTRNHCLSLRPLECGLVPAILLQVRFSLGNTRIRTICSNVLIELPFTSLPKHVNV